MKHYKILLITAAFFLFASCENGPSSSGDDELEEGTYEFPEDTYYFNIPSNAKKIIFPDEHDGKKCYVIYTNDTNVNLQKEDDKINFAISNTSGSQRSASKQDEITVSKTPFFAGGKYQREEVHFDYSKIKDVQKTSGRSAARSGNNTTRTYRDLSNTVFYINNYRDEYGNVYINPESFTLIKSGDKCRIWYPENAGVTISQEVFVDLAKSIDLIYEKETKVFGSNYFNYDSSKYINASSETKLDVLVYDIYGDATDDQNRGTFGLFDPNDFYLKSYYSKSNEAQVIHLDSHFLTEATEAVMSTAVHEFQHLLNFCNKSKVYETWYTEMLSMCAEDVFQTYLKIDASASPKNRFALAFNSPWKGFLTWPDSTDDDVYYAYANAYAFGAFLMRNFGGVNLIHEIATNQYVNETSITKALQALGYNEDFYSVLRKFGMIYIFTENQNYYSLCKNIPQTFSGTEYKLTEIFLSNYLFKLYESESEYSNDIKKYYDGENIHGQYKDTTMYLYYGPTIFKNSYNFTENIQPYGFTVFYAGNVNSDKEYDLKHKTYLTMTLVVKD